MAASHGDVREQLVRERCALEREIARFGAERSVASISSEGRRSNAPIDPSDDLQMKMREAALSFVAAAIERIDRGTYGQCTMCDRPVEPERLARDSATAYCARCAGAQGHLYDMPPFKTS